MLPPFFLFTLAFGGTYVPKINLIQDLICRDQYYSKAMMDGPQNNMCESVEVERAAAFFLGLASAIGGTLSALTSPTFGALSDRYGRKAILCIAASGSIINETITICAASFPESFPIWWFYIGFAIDGLSGTFIVAMALATSYAADCTPPSRRNTAFGYFYGCMFGGVALGPFISGKIVAASGSVLSIFYIALGCSGLFILVTALIIPESLSKRRQMIAREKHKMEEAQKGSVSPWRAILNFLRFFFAPLKILYPRGKGSSPALRRNLVLLSAIDTTVFGVAIGAMAVVTLYIRRQFHWNIDQQSQFVTAVNVSRVCALMVVLPASTRIFRGPSSVSSTKPQHQNGCDGLDIGIIRVSILLDMFGYIGLTLSRVGGPFILSGAFAAFGGMASPTISSSLTKHVPHDRTGQLLGAAGLLHALARVVAPAIFSGIYYSTVGKFDQTLFLCLACIFGLAFTASLALRKGVFLEESTVPGGSDDDDDDADENDMQARNY